MSIIQVCVNCHGKWTVEGMEHTYVGNIKTKGFGIRRGITYEGIIREIMKRFDLGCHFNEVVLNHRMSGASFWPPCAITDDADVDDLFTTYGEIGGALLYVTVDRSRSFHENIEYGRIDTMDPGECSQSRVELALDNATLPYPSLEMASLNFGTPSGDTQIDLYTDTPCPEVPAIRNGDEFDITHISEEENEEEDNVEEEANTEPPQSRYELPPGVEPSNKRTDGTGLRIGALFQSRLHFDEVVIDDALKTGDVYVSVKCSRIERQWRCNVPTCKWRARCAKNRRCTNLWKVTMYIGVHTCDLTGKSTDHKNCTSEYIAWRMRDQFLDVVKAPGTQKIRDWCTDALAQDVSKYKAWDAHRKGVWFVCGDAEQSYADIPGFLHLVKERNPGSITALKVDGSNRFLYCFVALASSIIGWTYMRPVVVIDAAFLKTEFKGQMVAAHAVDSEGHIFPLACGVIDVECNLSWGWFLKQLKSFVEDANDLVIVSDRHNAIKHAVAEVYPNAAHANCYYHLKQNLSAQYGNTGWEDMFLKATYTCSLKTHEWMLQCIRDHMPKDTDKKKSMFTYLTEDVGLEKWARVHCPTSRYEIMTSNPAESFNAAMVSARYVYPLPLLSHYLDKLIEWGGRHRGEGLTFNGQFTQKVTNIIRKNFEESKKVPKPVPVGYGCWNIPSAKYMTREVNTVEGTCSCGEWRIMKILCKHAIRVLKTADKIHAATAKQYESDIFRTIYREEVRPVPNRLEWERDSFPDEVKDFVCLPPKYIPKRGRRQTKRIPSKGEKVQSFKRKYNCGFCHQPGHHKRTCPLRNSTQ